jgi:Flp pilus assembly protein TadG
MQISCKSGNSFAYRDNISRILKKQDLRINRSRNSKTGQSLVEFALVLPVLILILYGIFDLGRAFYVLVTISNASREGARYMTTHVTVMDASVNNSRKLVYDQVKAEALGSGITLTDANIVVDCVRELDSSNAPTLNCAHGQDAYVRVSYTFTPLFSFIFPASIPIKWETRMIVP